MKLLNKRTYGKIVEDFVEGYLLNKNYNTIQRNFTIKGGEIDIIAQKGDEVVFIEVKSLANEKYIQLENTLSNKKRKTLIRTAQIWLKINSLEKNNYRIDFIGVVIQGGRVKRFLHIKSAVW